MRGRCVIADDVVLDASRAAGTRGPSAALVRVTVTSASRRVDLALPAMVPVAELVPELARSVGVLDAAGAHGGHRVLTADGLRLEPEQGLGLQGVVDGTVLTLAAGVEDPPAPVYDDVAEAVRDAVERDLVPWRPAAARAAAVAAGAVLLVLGALGLALLDDRDVAGTTGVVLALLLLLCAVGLSRWGGEGGTTGAAVTLAWVAVAYAVVAGSAWGAGQAPGVRPVVTGAAAALVGLIALLTLRGGRVLLAPALVVGAAYAVSGAVVLLAEASDGAGTGRSGATDTTGATTLAVLLVVSVVAGSVLPWVALSTRSRTDVASLGRPGGGQHAVVPAIDAAQVAADVRLAHEVLVAVAVSVGVLLVVAGPAVVGLGLAGALLALDACALVLLRSRHSRSRTEVATGLAAGAAGLVVVLATAVLTEDGWRTAVAVAGPVLGAGVLALALLPRRTARDTEAGLRRGRLGDVAETTALLALLPLLAWAAGLLGTVGTAAGRF